MKIGGVSVTAPPMEGPLVIPRQPPIAFWGQAIPDMEEFNRLCPMPTPPGKHVPNKGFVPDTDDKNWLDAVKRHDSQRTGYIIIKTLEPSNIEWDQVSLAKPNTWLLWRADFKKAKFTDFEIQRIINFVEDANGLNEAKLEQARELFLHGRDQEQSDISSPNSEPESSQSGEPASDLE